MIGLAFTSGIAYKNWFANAANAYRAVLLPLAACLGAVLYLFRRGSGWLFAGTAAHALCDLSTFLHTPGSEASGLFAIAGLISIAVYGMGAIALVFSWYRDRQLVA